MLARFVHINGRILIPAVIGGKENRVDIFSLIHSMFDCFRLVNKNYSRSMFFSFYGVSRLPWKPCVRNQDALRRMQVVVGLVRFVILFSDVDVRFGFLLGFVSETLLIRGRRRRDECN